MRVIQNVISNIFAVPCKVFDFVMVIPHAARHNHVLLHLDGAGRPKLLRYSGAQGNRQVQKKVG